MYKLSTNSVFASEISEFLKKELFGDNVVVYGPSNIESISNNSIIYLNREETIPANLFSDKEEILILSPNKMENYLGSYIVSDNPKLDFIKIIEKFFMTIISPQIHEKAVIENGAKIGLKVTIGSCAYIGNEVEIGDGTVILQNVVISGKVKIGPECIIKANSTIGSEVFDFTFGDNEWKQFPQVGNIIIGSKVWIGANSTIEKGALNDTRIGDNVKIDDLVQIGSGCIIGNDSLVAAGSIVSRDVKIGNNCWIAPNVSIKDNISIIDNTTIGLGSVVIRNIIKKDTYAGNPAKIISKE